MPKFILFSVFQILLFGTYAQYSKNFTLDGTVTGRSSGKLYLIYATKDQRIIDSAAIKNGRFVFHGAIEEPTKAELTDDLKLRNEGYGNYLSDFYLEPGFIKLSAIDGQFAQAKVTGSKTNEDYKQFTRHINSAFEKLYQLQDQAKADSNQNKLISDSLSFYTTYLKKYLLDFIVAHPDSYVGVMATQRLGWLLEDSVDAVLSAFNLLTPRIKNTNAAKKLQEALVNRLNSAIGHVAPDFKRKDVNGKWVALSSYKGQYVLLDFWASWCVPCRAQTPHVKELYEKYRAKGLKIIAISCDSKYDAWQNAIQKDSIESFVNILSFTDSDMDFLKLHDNVGAASFEGELRKQFNLMPIPVYILIDPKGVIIGRYGGTEKDAVEMLDKKLLDVFNKV